MTQGPDVDPSPPPAFVRPVLLLVAGVSAAFALGYALDVPLATATWPLPVTRLTHLFLAAFLVAFAAPTLWIARTGDVGALAGIALVLLVGYGTFAAAAAVLGVLLHGRFFLYAAIGAAVAVFGAAVFAWSRRHRFVDTRPTPRPVRAAFGVFAALLVLSGGAMVLGTPNVLPWRIDFDSQMLVGCLFLGAAAYFAYGIVRPAWPNAAGQLMAFLLYDLVLFPPLAAQLATVASEHRLSLLVYLAALVGSALLAGYYFLIDRERRVLAT